jgi:hypothetical protein
MPVRLVFVGFIFLLPFIFYLRDLPTQALEKNVPSVRKKCDFACGIGARIGFADAPSIGEKH